MWGALLGGAATLAGQAGLQYAGMRMSQSGDASAMEQQFRYNAGLQKFAHKQAKRWRRTHYQDVMKDLRKAGLNPLLAGLGGTSGMGAVGASVGDPAQGSRAVQQGAAMADRLVSSAAARARWNQEFKNLEATESRDREAARYNRAAANEKDALVLRTQAEQRVRELEAELRELQMHSARAAADVDASKPGRWMLRVKRFFENVPLLGNILRIGQGGKK